MENNINLFQNQVGGSHIILTDQKNTTILKPFCESQYIFYQLINKSLPQTPQFKFNQIIPKYKGTCEICSVIETQTQNQWNIHLLKQKFSQSLKKYIKIQNVTFKMNHPCILDIKLGIKKWKASHIKFKNSTTPTHNFRMCGVKVYQSKNNRVVFKDKYYHHNVGESEIQKNLAFYFFDGQEIKVNLIKSLITQLQKIINTIKQMKGYKFDSLSLLIVYDGKQLQDQIFSYLIDFGQFSKQQSEQYDNNRLKGLINLKCFLQNIVINIHQTKENILNCNDFRF